MPDMQSPYTRELWVLEWQIRKAQEEYNQAVSNSKLFDTISNSNPNKVRSLAIKKEKESYLNSLVVKRSQLEKANDTFIKNQWDPIKTDVNPQAYNPNSSMIDIANSNNNINKSKTYNSNSVNYWTNSIEDSYSKQISKNEKSFDDARTWLWLSLANRSAFNFWWWQWVSSKSVAQSIANTNWDMFDKLSALWIQKENLNSQLLWQKTSALQNQQQLDQNYAIQKSQAEQQKRQVDMQEDQFNLQKTQYDNSISKSNPTPKQVVIRKNKPSWWTTAKSDSNVWNNSVDWYTMKPWRENVLQEIWSSSLDLIDKNLPKEPWKKYVDKNTWQEWFYFNSRWWTTKKW